MATLSKRRAALMAGGSLVLVFTHLSAASADKDAPLGEVDISATRTEQPVANSASAITLISPQQVQTYGATGLTNVLRGTPGLDIWEFGGVGTLTSVSLRGSSTGQVLVLIDGVRANNPTNAGGAVDFGGFTAAGIEPGASVIYTGVPKLEVEARVTVVGANPAYDYTFYRNVTIPAYAKCDLFANYKLDDSVSVFGRMENLTEIRYQNAYLYGTPGRSVYGGVKYAW